MAKSTMHERVQQNLDIFDFALTDDDKKQIATLNEGASQFFSHSDPAMIKALANRKLNI